MIAVLAADDVYPTVKSLHKMKRDVKCIKVQFAAWGPDHELYLEMPVSYVRIHELLHIDLETKIAQL